MNPCSQAIAVWALCVIGCGTSPSDDDGPPCPGPETVGLELGDVVPNIAVRDCESSTVQLHDVICGHSVTLIDLGAAAFEACVEETDAYAVGTEYDDLQARGLQIVQIFVGDEQLALPTSLFCREYSEDHAIDFEFLIDPLRNTVLLSELYPFNIVVDDQARLVEKWAGVIPDDKIEILDSLLTN